MAENKNSRCNKWKLYEVVYIDDILITSGFRHSPDKDIQVSPIEHTFTINALFNNDSSDTCPCETWFKIKAKLEPNTAYKINGDPIGQSTKVWIEELDTGKRLTEVFNVAARPKGSGTFDVDVIDATVQTLSY